MPNIWTQPTGYNLGTISERTYTLPVLPISPSANGFTFKKIAGKFPNGIWLEDGVLKGVPLEVIRDTTSTFTVRASKDKEIYDCTFSITVEGADPPIWITNAGSLPIGTNNHIYILDNSYVYFHLSAIDPDLSAGDNLNFFINTKNSILPPGLSLSSDGIISGIIKPIIALNKTAGNGFFDTNPWDSNKFDLGIRANVGYDSFNYDTIEYDYFTVIDPPRKLNRTYEFIVSVSDNISVVDRIFKIFVVSDDFLRADNSLLRVGTNTFTADVSYVRSEAGIWLSPKDLGLLRANNRTIISLDAYDPIPYAGPMIFRLSDKNRITSTFVLTTGSNEITSSSKLYDIQAGMLIEGSNIPLDTYVSSVAVESVRTRVIMSKTALASSTTNIIFSSDSILPQDLSVDESAGLIFGTLPYQAAISRDYTFTINLVKYDVTQASQSVITLFVRQDAAAGSTSLQVRTANIADLSLLIGEYVRIDQNPTDGDTTAGFVLGQNIYRITSWVNDPSAIDFDTDKIININKPLKLKIPLGTAITKNVVVQGAASPIVTPKMFVLKTIGEIDSNISWITPSNLGSIKVNFVSTLKVEAQIKNNKKSTITNRLLTYTITSGSLPNGLVLSPTGEITGKAQQYNSEAGSGLTYIDTNLATTFDQGTTSFDREFKFTVIASDQYKLTEISREFSLLVTSTDKTVYSNIYIKPFLREDKRSIFSGFMSNSSIFIPSKIYRLGDPSFGVQDELKMLLYAGIETTNLDNYMSGLKTNIKRKRYKIGDLNIALAKVQGSNDITYELIYLDIIDDRQIGKKSVAMTISTNDGTKYLTSFTNIRKNLTNVSIGNRKIYRDNEYLPLWMKTSQDATTAASGLINVVPLCYCKPGQGQYILANIQNYIESTANTFSFNQFDFDIDRLIIDSSSEYDRYQYLGFNDNKYTI